jgi:streptogramin lyase
VLQIASTIAAGDYSITVKGVAGSATSSTKLPVTVNTTAFPGFYFSVPIFDELAVPIGGSAQVPFSSSVEGTAQYNVSLSVSGLPPGTSAVITPQAIVVGQSGTITIKADSNAPTSQNVGVSLVGTPDAPVPVATMNVLLSITEKPGSLPNNRTDYVSTEGTPYAATYDATHGNIFASVTAWNTVDIISSSTHTITKRISVPAPRGIDIAPDGSRIWVATASQQVFEIDPVTFAVKRHYLPLYSAVNTGNLQTWQGHQIFALSDGTLMFSLDPYSLSRWDPSSNTLTNLLSPQSSGIGSLQRSGDGKRLYSIDGYFDGNCFYYDAPSKSLSGVFPPLGDGMAIAVNSDSSRVAVSTGVGTMMYDGNLNFVGQLPGGGFAGVYLYGGMVFSADGRYLYSSSLAAGNPLIYKIDSSTLKGLSVAPALPMIPVMVELIPPFFIATPFAVDNTGLVFGIQNYGIAFDDAAFAQNFVAAQPGNPTFMQHMSPYSGPLAGGTTSSGFGNLFSLAPDIWYGANRGTVHRDSSGMLSITSPLSSTPGPVNLKFLFPDGVEVFDPLFFSYGPSVQYATLSGASPSGGTPGQIAGYGLPHDGSGGSVSIGGSTASITSKPAQYPPYTGSPFPSTFLNFTVPPGPQGWADITVVTPDGTSTLPKSLYYAKSVSDYPSGDTFTAVLYDNKRQQLYLSAGDHIDTFSLTSLTYLTPLQPPAIGASKQFTGLALTPDGSQLLAADLLDGSLAVVNPDNPSVEKVIPVAPVDKSDPTCVKGPFYVAPSLNNQVFVNIGGLPSIGCGPRPLLYQVDLNAGTSIQPANSTGCPGNAQFIASAGDGTKTVFSGGNFCVYDAASHTANIGGVNPTVGASIANDGNVAASEWTFTDSAANVNGAVARPDIYYSQYSGDVSSTFYLLYQPMLNATGSLYYLPYPLFFDIFDVHHGSLLMRFSLAETTSNTVLPLAIDSSGQRVFLITNKGLTIVDLGSAPLAIGSLSSVSATPGSQITLRGSGFTSTSTATVGGTAAVVDFIDDLTLSLTIPSLSSGPAVIVIKNADGSTYSLENAFTIP